VIDVALAAARRPRVTVTHADHALRTAPPSVDVDAETREHALRVAGHDPAERGPAAEDEAGEASIEDLGGTAGRTSPTARLRGCANP
jgi:hypothetical protein